MSEKSELRWKIHSLKSLADEVIKALDEETDEEYERLRRQEKDFTPHDGKTTHYGMYKIKHQPKVAQGTRLQDWWTWEVSDGWARISGSAQTIEEAYDRVGEELNSNRLEWIEHDWRHNKHE